MASKKDLEAGHAISRWNLAHGSVINDMTEALDRFAEATGVAHDLPTATTESLFRIAGRRLERVAETSLQGPWSGVPEYDDPRRRGLECYREAGALAGAFDPNDETDDRADSAIALLRQGRQVSSQATEYTRELTRRIQGG